MTPSDADCFNVTSYRVIYGDKPAHYDDVVLIETRLDSLSRRTLIFSYRILRENEDVALATGSTKHACVDGAGKVLTTPTDLVRILEQAVAQETSRKV